MSVSAISTTTAQLSPALERPVAQVAPAKLTPSALRNAAPEVQRAAVAAQFEAILVRQLLGKTMTSMLGGAESGVAGSVYGDLLADTLAQQLTAGQGLGLGRVLQQQLAPRGEPAAEKPPGA